MGLLTVWKAAVFKSMNLSKRGSVFLEAALIFPVIILTVAILIGYSSNSYEKVKSQVKAHNELREESLADGRIDKGESEFIRKIVFLVEEL